MLENTFLSIADMLDALFFTGASWLASPLLRMQWLSKETIATLKLPLLFLSSGRDEIVPSSHMRRLFELATAAPARGFVDFPDATHNDLPEVGGPRFAAALRTFLSDSCGGDGNGGDGGGGGGAPHAHRAGL